MGKTAYAFLRAIPDLGSVSGNGGEGSCMEGFLGGKGGASKYPFVVPFFGVDKLEDLRVRRGDFEKPLITGMRLDGGGFLASDS